MSEAVDRSLPAPAELRRLLRYEPETGKLFWLERQPDTVAADRESTRARIARNWNNRFQGKEALATLQKRGHLGGALFCSPVSAHRVAWAIHYGEWPAGQVDHINGDQTDNRIANLRCVSDAENKRNLSLRAKNKTGHHGVWWDERRGKYQAYIAEDKRRVSLGRFDRLEDAVAARQAAEARLGYHPNHGRPRAQPVPG